MNVSQRFPTKVIQLGGVEVAEDEFNAKGVSKATHSIREAFRSIVKILEDLQRGLAAAINFNEVTYISAAVQPTVVEGQMIVWKNTAAGAGTPKAFIVTMRGGVTYTFGSKELA